MTRDRKVGGYSSGDKTAEQMKPPPANITTTKTAEIEALMQVIRTRDAQITAIRAVAAVWAKKRDEPHRPMPWRSVYAQFVDGINDALGQL